MKGIRNFNHHVARLFAQSKISLSKILLLTLIFMIIHTAIIYVVQRHFEKVGFEKDVRNTVLSLLRIRNSYLSQDTVEPQFIHFRKKIDKKTQMNHYNVIFEKAPDSILVSTPFVTDEVFAQMTQHLLETKTLFITSPMINSKHKWITIYVFLKEKNDVYTLILLTFIMQTLIISLLLFMIYITRYIFPRLIIDSATSGLKEKPSQHHFDVPKDITLKFEGLREKVQQLIYEKTLMLASMSHDMRNSLTKLRLLVHFIEHEKTSENMMTEFDEIQMIIDSSLAFSEGSEHKEVKPFNLSVYMDDLTVLLKKRGYQFEFENKLPKNTKIQGYPALLKRAIMNVVNNAVKYSEQYGVTCYIKRKYAVIAVKDNGKGISEESLLKISMPYQRSKEAAAGDVEGYGLGLAITKTAIDFHRGKLRYKNMKPRGLEVSICLPLTTSNV